MTDFPQGGVAFLQVTFLDRPGGVPVDPTVVSLSIFQGATLIAGPFTLAAGQVVRDQVGLFHYSWSVPATQPLSETYVATWTATISATVRSGYETFGVVAGFDVITGPAAGWASTTDVQTITGAIVSPQQLAQAQSIIDMVAGRTYLAYARTGTRDQYWMKLAVAYQAAWMVGQPDIFSRLDFTEIGKERGTPVKVTPTAMVLAPMSRWALKRVSWLKSRSLHVLSPYVDGLSPVSPDASSSANDFYESWTGM